MRPSYPLIALIVLAAALRFPTLGLQSLWADEAFTAQIAGGPGGDLLDRVADTESTPPLHYALTWLWVQLFGDSEWSLRALPALWGTLTVPAVHAGARATFASERAGLFAAALAATAPILVWYSQEARAYALLVALCAVAYWALVSDRRGIWAAASAAALATHYFAVFSVVPQALWLLWRRRAVTPLLAPALTGLALLPLLAHQSDTVARPWSDLFTVADQLAATVQELIVGRLWTWVIHRPGLVVIALLWAACAYGVLRARERRALLPAGLAAVAVVAPLAVSLVGENYLAPRNVLGAWPLLAVVLGAGAALQRRGALLVGATCAVWLAIVAAGWFEPRLQRDDWRGLLDPDPAPALLVVDGFNHQRVVQRYVEDVRPAREAPPGDVAVVGHARSGEARFSAPPAPGAIQLGAVRRGDLRMTVWRVPAPVLAAPGDALLVAP